MTDPILEQFARACGARQPWGLSIYLFSGEKLAEGEIESPFVLVGRDDACDVTLTDAEVDPRHLWLQVVEGQLYAVDLGSRAGLIWSDGSRGSGWLRKDRSLSAGPFVLKLERLPAEEATSLSESYQPLQSDASLAWRFPTTVLEFRNGKRARDRWQVNRRLTLIGRAPECKIRLSAEDITRYHCGLVYTAQGLWIVDLSGHGVVVNGERMRVAPLEDGADLWVGRFRLGVHVGAEPSAANAPSSPASARSRPTGERQTSEASSTAGELLGGTPAASPPSASIPDDEVPLGHLPSRESDSASGLSNSHILAEEFAPGSGGGDISQSILIAQSGSLTPPPQPRPTGATGTAVLEELSAAMSGSNVGVVTLPPAVAAETREESQLVAVLHAVGQLHQRMAALLQQSCALLAKVGQYLQPEHQLELEDTLTALRHISESLQDVESGLSRLARETPKEIRYPPPRVPAPPPPSSSPLLATGRTTTPQAAPEARESSSSPTQEAVLYTLPHARLEPRSQSRHNTAG